jgi:hypothetical protein
MERQRSAADDALREETEALARVVAIVKEPLNDYKQNSSSAHDTELQQLREQHNQIVTRARATRDGLQREIDALKARRAYTEEQKTRIFGLWSRYLATARTEDGQVKKRYAEITQLRQQQPQQQRQKQQRLLTALKQAEGELAPFDCHHFPDAQQSLHTLRDRINELEEKMRRGAGSPMISAGLVAGFMALPDLRSPATDTVSKPRVAQAPTKPTGDVASKVYTFTVTAGQWHPTGLQLKKGQGFDVKATGKLIGSDGFEVGPDGGGYWRWWILHGKIGDKIFPIGSGGYERAPEDGQLELGIPRVGGKHVPEDANFNGAYIVKIYGVP